MARYDYYTIQIALPSSPSSSVLLLVVFVFSLLVSSTTTDGGPSGAAGPTSARTFLSHSSIGNAVDKMSLADFDKYLGSYVGDDQRLALILDYDGTLAEITPHPDMTIMTPEMKQTLRNIANSGKVFVLVISGRDVLGVKEKIGLENIIFSGNHGLEVLYTDGRKHNHGIPPEIAANFDKMVAELEKICPEGAWVENKKVSITLHHRQADQALVPMLEEKAKQIIESYGYRANHAHAAIEGKPPIEWNKGLAAEYIMNESFDKDWRNRKIIFAGDDTTDEDVMRMIKGHGRSFRISKDKNVKTNGDYVIESVNDVLHMLKWIERKVTM